MKYLIELQFTNGVHFGSDQAGYGKENVQGYAHSDTIFSALINSLASIKHEFRDHEWAGDLLNGKPGNLPFKLSSFGFVETDKSDHKYYLPVPLKKPRIKNLETESYYKKRFKKRKFTSLSYFQKWQNNEPLDLEDVIEKDEKDNFWIETLKGQHLRDSITARTQIYHTGVSFYHDFVFPFFIIDLDETKISIDDFFKILNVMKINGLGGRRTGGSGAFEINNAGWFGIDDSSIEEMRKVNPEFQVNKNAGRIMLNEIFNKKETDSFYLFSTFFSSKLNSAALYSYNLIPRKGWFYSTSSYAQLKRKTCFMLSEGSIFKERIEGELADVTPDEFGDHKIFRYGLPFYIPFSRGEQ